MPKYNYIIVNEDVQTAAKALMTIIEAERNAVKNNDKFIKEILNEVESL